MNLVKAQLHNTNKVLRTEGAEIKVTKIDLDKDISNLNTTEGVAETEKMLKTSMASSNSICPNSREKMIQKLT